MCGPGHKGHEDLTSSPPSSGLTPAVNKGAISTFADSFKNIATPPVDLKGDLNTSAPISDFKGQSIGKPQPTTAPSVQTPWDTYFPKQQDVTTEQQNKNLNINIPFTDRVASVPNPLADDESVTGKSHVMNTASNFLVNLPGAILQAIPRAIVTTYEEIKNKTVQGEVGEHQLSPVLASLYGSDTYKNTQTDIQQRLANGDGILSAYLGAISNKVLDVAFGGAVAASGFKLVADVLAKGGDVAQIEAWRTLGSPTTSEEASTNFRKMVQQFTSDPAYPGSASPQAYETLTKARAILDEKGIPSTMQLAQQKAAQYAEVVGRETKLGQPLYGLDVKPKVPVQPKDLNLPKLPGYRTEEGQAPAMGLSIQKVEPVGFGPKETPPTEVAPTFQGFQDISTNILEKLKDRDTVSKQFISDLTNSPDLKQAERDIIRTVLESYPSGAIVPVKEFADKVKAELLPLKRTPVRSSEDALIEGSGQFDGSRYEGISLPPDSRGPVENYDEHIYESPIKTSAGDVHFSGDTQNYFGHTRVEDVPGNTRRIIEVQSDLYQKGNLEREMVYPKSEQTRAEVLRGLSGEDKVRYEELSKKNFEAGLSPDEKVEMGTLGNKSLDKLSEIRGNEAAKLQQYSNPTAHFRMVREEIKQAAIDGKAKLQFPTGETAMKIEGLGTENTWNRTETDSLGQTRFHKLFPDDLKTGLEVDNGYQKWIITDVLGDGKFKAIASHNAFPNTAGKIKIGEDFKSLPDGRAYRPDMTETFDISGKVDTSNPIYKFYEKDLGKYLTNKYGAKVITDAQGVKWYQIDVPKSAAKEPVIAFKKTSKYFPFGRGPKASTSEIANLLKGIIPEGKVDLVFDPELIKQSQLGSYQPRPERLINIGLRPLITLYEKGGQGYVRTAFHEAFHYLMDRVYTPEENRALLDETLAKMTPGDHEMYSNPVYDTADKRAAEYLADEYAKSETTKAGYKSPLQTIIDKIKAFLKKVIDGVKKILKDMTGPEGKKGMINLFGDTPKDKITDSLIREKFKTDPEAFYEAQGKYPQFKTVDEAKQFIGEVQDTIFYSKALDNTPFRVNEVTSNHLFNPDVKLRTPEDFVRRAKILGAGIEIAENAKYIANEETKNGYTYFDILGTDPINSPGRIIQSTISQKDGKVFLSVRSLPMSKAEIPTPGKTPTPVRGASIVQPPEGGGQQGGAFSDFQAPVSKLTTESLSNPEENVKQPLADESYSGQTLKPTPLERKLENLYMERDMHVEALDYLKSKVLPLMKHIDPVTGRLPEVTGKPTRESLTGSGKTTRNPEFGIRGDDIVTENGFENVEDAQQAIDDYKNQMATTKEYNARIGDLKERIKIQKSENNDVTQLSKFLERAAKRTDKQAEAMQKALEHPETAAELKARKEAATERMITILQKTYNSTPHLERETPQWLLQATEKSYETAMTEEEHAAMDAGDPYKMVKIDASTPLKEKVNLIDYFRTPDRVLSKIGLGDVGKTLRHGYESYLAELPVHLDLITDWKHQVPSAEANKRIFQYLDGQYKPSWVPLTKQEKAVAWQIKNYLREWADRLGLPADSKISHYITHIFGLSGTEKEFDEDLAKVIHNKVPGGVYDPFLEERLGRKGYIEDTWRALDAYVKRAVRKANMDPALEQLKRAVSDPQGNPRVEVSIYNYVKRYGDRVNMRPTEWDNLLDNSIKQVVGYKFGGRPTAFLTSTMRKWVSRSLLGLNFNNAIKNLTQGVNTFAALGTKYTTIGYTKLMTNMNSEEFRASGLMSQNIAQDKTVSAVKQTMQKLDTGLYALHTISEYINRGAAYWGAKAKAIDEGMSEYEAVQYAKKIGRDTQFNYGSIDTPVAIGGDIAKTLTQFMSYPIKQTEFIAELLQNKEWSALIRYILGAIFAVTVIGKVFNIKAQDFIPLSFLAPQQVGGTPGVTKFGNPPALALPESIWGAITGLPGSVNPTKGPKGGKSALEKTAWNIFGNIPFPAGLQIKKTAAFIKAMQTPKKSTTKGKKSALMF